MRIKGWIGLGVAGLAIAAFGFSAAAQTRATNKVMRDKLVHSQRILEALTTSNNEMLTRESEALAQVLASPQWDQLRTPEFAGYTETFAKATSGLVEAAKARDLDTAALRYGDVVTSCYACHRYRKAARLVVNPRR